MNRIGFAKTIAQENAVTYASGSAMGVILVDNEDAAFFTVGRIMERVWLEATRLGLSFQLVSGILFFYQRLKAGNFNELSAAEAHLVEQSYREIADIIKTDKTIALLFRIGVADPPSAYSSKRSPIILS